MKSWVILFSLILTSSMLAYADSDSDIQRVPGKVECNTEVMRCTYTAQNLTAKDLVARINAVIFPGSILSPSEGYINIENLKKINFYFTNEALMQRFINLIPLMDVIDDFSPVSLVQLTTEIYSLSNAGFTELQAQLTATENNPATDIATSIITSISGTAGMGLKIGTNFLSSVLGSKKVKEESSMVTTVTQLIPNMAGINFSHGSKIYISPTAGVVKDEFAGLNINGTVSISASDSDLVLVKDYAFSYGVLIPADVTTKNDTVNILSISNPQLYLVRGVSSLIVSSLSTKDSTKTEYSALNFGKSKEKMMSKIMVVTRAESIGFKEYIQDMKKIRTLDLHREFTQDEKDHFPNDEVNMEDLLNHIKPYSFFSTSGDRILGFTLDKKDARVSNINKNIEISIKSGGFFSPGSLKQKTILSVENLMLSGIKFDSLSSKDIDKTKVKITVKLKPFNANGGVTKVLYYNPETNKFIE